MLDPELVEPAVVTSAQDAYRRGLGARRQQPLDDVAAEEATKDAFFKAVWDDLQAFRADYKIWKDFGFLPRPKPSTK